MSSPDSQPAFLNPAPADQTVLLLLGRLDGKVDQMLLNDSRQDQRLTTIEARISTLASKDDFSALECRVTGLETLRNRALGGCAAMSALVAAAGTYLLPHFWK